jgi:hypothetical protein
MSGIGFDFSEVLKLAADLGEVPDKAGPNIRKAVEVTARKIKDDWRNEVAGSNLAPGGESAISYDLRGGNAIRGSEITAEIGPELGGAGSLVGLVEYGTATSGPRGYGAAALERNQEDFQKGLEIALEQAERAAGL